MADDSYSAVSMKSGLEDRNNLPFNGRKPLDGPLSQ